MKGFIIMLSAMCISLSVSAKEKENLSKKVRKEVVQVFKVNESLHSAFFKYDKEKVVKKAKKLSQAIDAISEPKVKKLLTFSQKKLGEITATASRKKNNENYHLVSMALIHVLNKFDLGEEYGAYSCPMVKKKWVQNKKVKKKVHNPYAPKMPHCGVMED